MNLPRLSKKEREELTYRDKARLLASVGKDFSFSRRGGFSPQQKTWITRRWREYAGYFNPENQFTFVKADRETRRELRHTLADRQVTDTGAFVQRPAKGRVRITAAGQVAVSKGRMREEEFKFSAKRLAKDPDKEIKRVLAEAQKNRRKGERVSVMVTVGGYQQKSGAYNVRTFYSYARGELIPELRHPKEGYRKKGMTHRQIARHFGVKVVYHRTR